MSAIMSEEKKPEANKITLTGELLTKYFPPTYTPQRMEGIIIKLLEQWQRKQRQQEPDR